MSKRPANDNIIGHIHPKEDYVDDLLDSPWPKLPTQEELKAIGPIHPLPQQRHHRDWSPWDYAVAVSGVVVVSVLLLYGALDFREHMAMDTRLPTVNQPIMVF